MKHVRKAPLIAVLALAATAALAAANGIEVLDITSTSVGEDVTIACPAAPLGSYAEAVMNTAAGETVVDMAPLGPGGIATVTFPTLDSSSRVDVRAPDTTLFASEYVYGTDGD